MKGQPVERSFARVKQGFALFLRSNVLGEVVKVARCEFTVRPEACPFEKVVCWRILGADRMYRGQARSTRREGVVDKSYPRVAALLRIKRGIARSMTALCFSRARASLRFESPARQSALRSITAIERLSRRNLASASRRWRCVVVMRISIGRLARTAIPVPAILLAQSSTRALRTSPRKSNQDRRKCFKNFLKLFKSMVDNQQDFLRCPSVRKFAG